MRKIVFLLIAAILLTGISSAYTIKQENKIIVDDFKGIIGKKFVSFDTFVISLDRGNIFFLARDIKTRNLEWFLLNPYSKKVLRKGSCPFKAFNRISLSPDDGAALVYSRYPTALWRLDIMTKKWENLFENPGKNKGGLAIMPISPLFFMESFRAFSIMDLWDKEHFVMNTFITAFTFEPFSISKVVSLKYLRDITIKKVFNRIPSKWQFRIDFFRFGEEKNLLLVLKSRTKNRKIYKDYLFHFSPPREVTIVEEIAGRILPLDYHTRPMKILYSRATAGNVEVIFTDGKKKNILLKQKVITGRIMKNNLIGVAAVRGRKFVIFLGTPSETLKEVKALNTPYRVGFITDGRKLILMDNKTILCYRIKK